MEISISEAPKVIAHLIEFGLSIKVTILYDKDGIIRDHVQIDPEGTSQDWEAALSRTLAIKYLPI